MTELSTMLTYVRYRADRLRAARNDAGASALEFILLAVAVVALVGLAVVFVRRKIRSEGGKL